MTNENETPARTAKRVRIDENPQVIQIVPPTLAPSAAAAEFVSAAVASHHKTIQSFAKSISKEYNVLKSISRQQASTQARFADDTFMPRSARINFNLTATATVMETDEFKTAAATMTLATEAYMASCKKAIAGAGEMVIKENKEKTKKLFVRAIDQLSTLLLIEHMPETDVRPTKEFIWYVIDQLNSGMIEACFAKKSIITKNALRHAIGLADDAPTEGQYVVIDQMKNNLFQSAMLRLKPLLQAIFVDSWNCQLTIFKQNDLQAAMVKQAKEFLTEPATKDAAMEVDQEPTVEPKIMSKMIDERVKAALKKQAQTQQRSSERKQPAKNFSGGAVKGAPLKKKQQPGKESSAKPAPKGRKEGKQNQGKKKPGQKEKGPSAERNESDSQKRNKKQPNKTQKQRKPKSSAGSNNN
jgi:hypothetical protein